MIIFLPNDTPPSLRRGVFIRFSANKILMLRRIKTDQLKVGMYVILPMLWLKHDFFKNKFLIKSEKQLINVMNSGIEEVTIDTSKGEDINESTETVKHNNHDLPQPKVWEPEKILSDELSESLRDENMPPYKKAKIVYNCSLEIMKKLLDSPTAEKIQEGRKSIFEVVDVILSDDATSRQLLNVISHDFYTHTHSVNVGVLSVLLSKTLFKGSRSYDMQELGFGFFLHDLGKTRVDLNILNKPGRLTEEEMSHIRIHPYEGYKILDEATNLSEECRVIVLQHHEREDGTGYPRRLKGEEIHDLGRICCIADVFDALTSERPYRVKLSTFKALKIMKEEMMNHFHNEIFEEFVLLYSEKQAL